MHGIKRRLAGALVALPVIAGSLVVGSTSAQAVLGSAVHGPACPEVMVIAARGASETPQGSRWASPASYNADKFNGVGEFNKDMYDTLARSQPGRTSLDPVMYPAIAIPKSVLTNPRPLQASVATGVTALVAEVNRVEQSCKGAVKYVFTGYSEGAWVIHDALYKLSPTIHNKVVGVTLFGDPLYVPGEDIVRGVAPDPGSPWYGAATRVDPGSESVPGGLVFRTASYCLTNDPVCQAVNGPLVNPAAVTTLAYC